MNTLLAKKSAKELKELRARIDAELLNRSLKDSHKVHTKVVNAVRSYRNPDNQFETWCGRGRRPEWVKAQLAKGKTLKDLVAE